MTATKTKRMTKAQKRVAIARDVIAQLKAKETIASRGKYVMLPSELALAPPDSDLGCLLKIVGKPCEACAKGSMFLAHVRRFDGIKLSGKPDVEFEFDQDEYACEPLRAYFSQEQLNLIECAYEKNDVSHVLPFSAAETATAFGQRFESNTDRLIAICRNIIKNSGVFRP